MRTSRTLIRILPILLVGGLSTGCAAAVGADDPTATPTTPDEAPGTPAEAPVADGVLPDGDHFGFVVAVTTNPATISIDLATWVNDDTEPNGYRIDNPEADPVTVPVADDAELEVLRSTGDPATAEVVTIDGLLSWFNGLQQPDELAGVDIVITDGEVTGLHFVYRP